ncbi:MAG: NAD(P)/FAD-dependent oxidoreductase [Actinomycetia bacterium]|nr:NAD(P)/FAD-dependent oxidoreductase [Actinomycetes bacterium]
MTESVDLLIVGAGPVGIYGAYYAGARSMSTVVLDSLEEPGGQITAMYPEKSIFDVGGIPGIRGRDLVAQLVAQAEPFHPHYRLGEQAVGLARRDGGFTVTTSKGEAIECRGILITGGIGTFTPRPLPTGGEYAGRGVVNFVPDPNVYAGSEVVVVGGGDSAVDWALMLEPIAKAVTLVHRRAGFRAHPHSVDMLRASSVQILTDAQVSGVFGDPNVEAVEVTVLGEPRRVPCDTLIAALGFTANLGPLLDWGLEISKRQIAVNSQCATNIPGIYAAGDIVDYLGKVKLIATGFGEAATAVNNLAAYLDPEVSAFPGHLSDYAAPAAAG